MSYLDHLLVNTSESFTENGAKTHSTSGNACLDFFAQGAAKRGNLDQALNLFKKAYSQDAQLALRCLFWIRDIRGGQGERLIFRTIMKDFCEAQPDKAIQVLRYISEYGRWDDLIFLLGASEITDKEILKIIYDQFIQDVSTVKFRILDRIPDNESGFKLNPKSANELSLLGKWLPSENATSKATIKKAKIIRKHLKIDSKLYRNHLTMLRKEINILENNMRTKDYKSLDYSKIPSQAFRKHIKAFKRNDNDKFETFIRKAKTGEVKVNTSTLYTYEIMDVIRQGEIETAEALWTQLPDYCQGKTGIVVADVSGSMYGRPMDVSVSLALYFAERNTGIFKDHFITFSSQPQLQKISGDTLAQKLSMIENDRNWNLSTNLEGVFNVLLKTAISSGEPCPDVVYIISDMEFDRAMRDPDETVFNNAKKLFNEADVKMPHVVFWNVDSRQNNLPATMFDGNVTLISGLSQSIFNIAVKGLDATELMLEVLNSSRYEKITC